MKRYIHPADFEINVQIIVEEVYVPQIMASKIRPIKPNYPDDPTVDEQALADYDAFVEESILWIEDLGLEVLESNSSSKSETSRYFTIADEEQHSSKTMRYMIFLQISDHDWRNLVSEDRKKEISKAVREHQERIRDKYINEQGHKVKWKVKKIIVNDKEFDTYDQAVEEVEKLAKEWSDFLKNNPYQRD